MAEKGSIPEVMKALVAYGKSDYRLEYDYPVPKCGPEDILIQTEACGICAGDLKCMHGAKRFWGNDTEPSWVKPPFIPGHEFLGHIVAMGEKVEGYVNSVNPEDTGCASLMQHLDFSQGTTEEWQSMSVIRKQQ